MFDKILIANRGEIACRVARTAKRLGIRTVAVFSEADANALHVAGCDEAYLIGPAHPRESYLRADRILEAARKSGAQAIHPGYGFLSENAEFVKACGQAGVAFIGPPAEAIESMGSKSTAKALMEKAGVPLVPGYHGVDQDAGMLKKEADRIGYPVLIKASAGGGGKGMRVVGKAADFADALAAAKREAASSFGDERVLIEKYLTRSRHIEVQVFADTQKHCVYLFERDCSVQRRHQKILEEAPAPGMTAERRRDMGNAAVSTARAVGYVNAGTVEFIADEHGHFYFMEMNTRLQVEHPVTEMITGLDLVEWQLRVASGESLPLAQEQLAVKGHAIEARVYAEDPARGFLPAAGRIEHLRQPEQSEHVRVDSGVKAGDEVGVHYDPMIAKLIAWDSDRPSALRRLRAALGEFQIVGPTSNLAFLSTVTAHRAFAEAHREPGLLDTGLIERYRTELFRDTGPASDPILAIAVLSELLRMDREAAQAATRSADPFSPWNARDGWRLNEDNHHTFVFIDAGKRVEVVAHYRNRGYLLELPGGKMLASGEVTGDRTIDADLGGNRTRATVVCRAGELTVFAFGGSHRLQFEAHDTIEEEDPSGGLVSPLPGAVIQVLIKDGEAVQKGQALMIIEAMKMEHTIAAPQSGTVKRIYFAAGEQVAEGVQLLEFEETTKA
ncbi:MAG TPA: acetyl/propionyl/methylcrotonyl-CoA carboxylase subunit alpha [Burkholderiales bacterium]|jgi:3-methylcrotonyl-CoA carboxylase alpha subunit|nr:acetyl/propionyl/methylcrotonyl-CoA carboxylase subunit alpha [Burkholderiales bacterium]